tara:strand:+ start:4 stop:3060 length:3057 start_codon:yes stop_codon:yes gene_type:complete
MKKLVNLFSLLLLMTGLIGFAQNSVSGVVSDSDGLPLPGATVVVQGTAIGVTTDFDGNYSISASEGDVLVFSYVGYVSQSIEVGASATINVSLESSTALDEVVVTGIGAVERQRSVSSIVTIGEEQIEGLAFTNPSNALQGRVAGLRVATISGAPGSPTSIRIRGEGSLTGNNSPLFVIDGVPIVNGSVSAGGSSNPGLGILSMINGDDIESITVLKDASSTAAYGNRGSNGVIVITTKKGSAGKVQYNLSSQYGFQNYAVEGREMLTGAQYAELATEMMMNRVPTWDSETAYGWVRRNLPGYQAWEDGGQVDGGWSDLVRVKDAPIQKYNLSASGGDATQNFRISLGYTQQDGTSIGSDYEQVSGSFSYTRKAGKVTLSTSNRVSNALLNGQLEGSAYFGNPQATRYFMRENWASKNPDGSWLVPHPAAAHHTPYLLEENIYKVDNTRAISNSSVSIDIMEGLKIKSVFAMDYNIGSAHEFQNPIEGDGVGEQGYAEQRTSRRFTWSTINSVEYNTTLGNNEHFISAILQQSFQKNKSDAISGSGEQPAAPGLYYLASFPTNRDVSGSFSDWRQLSYTGVLNYSYKDKYIANFTWRNDGSSRFASGYRFGDFFSVGAAWNISAENFLADSSIVNNLKLRVSYGETGDSNIGLNQYQSLFGYSGDYNDSGVVYPTSFGNAIISWEKAEKLDAFVDFGLFNNRLVGSVGYYERNSNDLLQSVPLSLTTGHSSQTQNVGDVVNKGIEVEFDATVVKVGDFSWDLYGNYTTIENEITRLAQTADGEDINLDSFFYANRVGRPIDTWFMRQWGGVDPQTGNAYFIEGGDADAGPVSTERVESWSAANQTFLGNKLPTYQGGIGTRLNYKNLTVDANFVFQGGHKIYEYWATYYMHTGLQALRNYAGAAELMNRWQQPGDITDVPRMQYTYSTTGTGSYWNSRFLSDGDMVRLRDLTVNYRVPGNLVESAGLDAVNVYVKGTNIWTWTKADIEYDPEVPPANGFNNIYVPIPKSWQLGVNLTF